MAAGHHFQPAGYEARHPFVHPCHGLVDLEAAGHGRIRQQAAQLCQLARHYPG